MSTGLAIAIVIIGPPVFAVTAVAIGCVVRRIRRGKRPGRLQRALAHAQLTDAMGRIYDVRTDQEAS